MPADVDRPPATSAGAPLVELRSWQDSWQAAALGERGYWWSHRVADGFRTSAATSPGYAAALLAVLDSMHTGPHVTRVIDVGAGDGELITAIAAARPELRCLGVDVRPRPGTSDAPGPGRAGWLLDRWQPGTGSWSSGALAGELADRRPTMIICSEWLDEIPVPVLDVDGDGAAPVVVRVAPDGTESGPAAASGTPSTTEPLSPPSRPGRTAGGARPGGSRSASHVTAPGPG